MATEYLFCSLYLKIAEVFSPMSHKNASGRKQGKKWHYGSLKSGKFECNYKKIIFKH